jgi:prolyl-tRNA editing enzyme YbaK/EbsC (Cys-tRNA(Pro) deacylase)
MARVTVTESELIDALSAAINSQAPEDARTVHQLARASGVPESRVVKTLRALHEEGRVIAHRVPYTALDGRKTTVPAYTILPAKKAKR